LTRLRLPRCVDWLVLGVLSWLHTRSSVGVMCQSDLVEGAGALLVMLGRHKCSQAVLKFSRAAVGRSGHCRLRVACIGGSSREPKAACVVRRGLSCRFAGVDRSCQVNSSRLSCTAPPRRAGTVALSVCCRCVTRLLPAHLRLVAVCSNDSAGVHGSTRVLHPSLCAGEGQGFPLATRSAQTRVRHYVPLGPIKALGCQYNGSILGPFRSCTCSIDWWLGPALVPSVRGPKP
jgi:hypothetical protein